MEVYLDVLLFENLLMNYLILYVVSRVMKQKTKSWRLFLGAAIGATYALLTLFLPVLTGAWVWVCKLLLSFFMIAAVFWTKNYRNFLKYLVCFYAVTFLFAGTAFAVILLGVPIGSIQNGAFVLHWDSPVNYLLLVAGCGWITIRTITGIIKEKRELERSVVSLYVEFDGNGLWIPALVDTGNGLKDPFTGSSVIVIEAEAISALFPPGISDVILHTGKEGALCRMEEFLVNSEWARRFRLIPYQSLGCTDGMLPGFRPDYITVRNGQGESGQERNDVIICLYDKPLSENHSYRALLAPELLSV